MDELIKSISKYPNGTRLLIEWQSGLKLNGEIDTIYETDNGLDIDDKNYKEFFSCLLRIFDVLTLPPNLKIEKDDFIEITMQDPPLLVMLENYTVVWKQ